MLFVVELPVAPCGNVQIYEVAPGMAGVVKTCPLAFRQTPAGPSIAVGVAKVSEPLQVTVI